MMKEVEMDSYESYRPIIRDYKTDVVLDIKDSIDVEKFVCMFNKQFNERFSTIIDYMKIKYYYNKIECLQINILFKEKIIFTLIKKFNFDISENEIDAILDSFLKTLSTCFPFEYFLINFNGIKL